MPLLNPQPDDVLRRRRTTRPLLIAAAVLSPALMTACTAPTSTIVFIEPNYSHVEDGIELTDPVLAGTNSRADAAFAPGY